MLASFLFSNTVLTSSTTSPKTQGPLLGSFVFWATKRANSFARVRESNGGAMFSAFFLKQKMGEPRPAFL